MEIARRHLRTWGTALAVCLAACAAAIALPGGAGARPLVTGLSDPEAALLGEQVVFDRVRDAGATFIRVTAYWQVIAPQTEPHAWNPADPNDPKYNSTSN